MNNIHVDIHALGPPASISRPRDFIIPALANAVVLPVRSAPVATAREIQFVD
jgi:hypothetical protein